MIEQDNTFVNDNRLKLENYVRDIEIIADKIPTIEFRKDYDNLVLINPKIHSFWDVLSMGVEVCVMYGLHWYNMANWKELLNSFESEIIEFIDFYKNAYPEYF